MPSGKPSLKTLPAIQEIEQSKLFCNAIVEEKPLAATNAVGAGMWLLDKNMEILWMNEAMEKVYGSLKDLKGTHCFSAFRGRASKCEDCLPTKAFDSGNIITGYISRRTRDGVERHYQLVETPLMDESSGVSRVLELVLDVTEQTRLSQKLADSETEYRALFEHAGTAVVETDERGMLVKTNQLFEELSGYKREELEGKCHYLQFVHPRDRDRVNEYDRNRQADPGSAPEDYEFTFINRWGAERRVHILVNSLPESQHQISSLIDVTEKHRLEQEVRSKDLFLANILRYSVDGIIALDPEDRIRSFNRGAELIFGFSAKDVIGKRFSMLLAPKFRRSQVMNRMAEQFRRDGYLRNHVVEAVTQDGRAIVANITRTMIRDESQRVLGSSAIIRDITESQRMEQRLIQQEKVLALGELAATLAHEVKNPLNSMVINMEVMKGHLSDLPKPKAAALSKYADIFSSEIQRLNRVMQGVLDFARPLGGSFEKVSLGAVLQQVLDLVNAQAQRSNVKIRLTVDPALPAVEGVEDHLKQVFINLLLNAFQVMPKGGKVDIKAAKGDPGTVSISISDTGPGIPRRNYGKVFELYFSTKEKGTGLGLPLVKRLVEAHGGKISFKSRVGHGTTFDITFPSA